ncbi:MAG: helix-turn-helix transcriptional regulator [Prolixibacteraceae bacterium]|nr:helix-turn-helix transcriptional regulator [Prolixibacteraceae bacterium]
MYSEIIGESFTFHLRNAAFLRFTGDSDYLDIISPFSRLYLVTEGIGYLIVGHDKIKLEAGNLYLIPSFTRCTYHFSEALCHYYIHFSIEAPNGLSPYSMYSFTNKALATDLDKSLFNRLVQINPDLQLPHHHPNVYQTKLWMNKKVVYSSASQYLETTGIIKQLFSRFLEPCQSQIMTSMLKYNIQPILLHIQNNLGREISVNELANMACFSKDHFSRVFKSITGLPPCDYIIRKRIERAQFLLLTTEMGQKEIIEGTGFRSASYFSRIFKKYTSYTPEKYRKQRG